MRSFSIEVPPTVLTDVPVRKIVIRALDANGKADTSYNEQPLITGIRLAVPQTDDAKLGPFHDGILELTTDLHAGARSTSPNRRLWSTQENAVRRGSWCHASIAGLPWFLRWSRFCCVFGRGTSCSRCLSPSCSAPPSWIRETCSTPSCKRSTRSSWSSRRQRPGRAPCTSPRSR